MSIRIDELAKEIGLGSHALLRKLKERGLVDQDIQSVQSTVSETAADEIRREHRVRRLKRAPYHTGPATILSDILGNNIQQGTFTVWIDPGDSSENDLVELFAALSELNRAVGGPGLTFARDPNRQPLVLEPAT